MWDRALAAAQERYPHYKSIKLGKGSMEVDPDPSSPLRKTDRLTFDPQTGEVTAIARHEDTPASQTLKGWMAQAKYPPFKVRLNTNGLGNLINHKNIVPDLRRVVDVVNVSLNAENETVWRSIVCPAAGYENGYGAVCEFIRLCVAAGFERVVASCVDQTGADAQAVKKVAEECGAEFYLRSFLDAQN